MINCCCHCILTLFCCWERTRWLRRRKRCSMKLWKRGWNQIRGCSMRWLGFICKLVIQRRRWRFTDPWRLQGVCRMHWHSRYWLGIWWIMEKMNWLKLWKKRVLTMSINLINLFRKSSWNMWVFKLYGVMLCNYCFLFLWFFKWHFGIIHFVNL